VIIKLKKKTVERLQNIIRNLRGLESLWGARGEGRLLLLGVQVNDDRICISEENALVLFVYAAVIL
jgi:hypothetical protein